jgi:hypothetical protein
MPRGLARRLRNFVNSFRPPSVEDLRPLTPDERARFIAHIRHQRGKLLDLGSKMSKTFGEAFRWANNVRMFETMFHDPHTPGNGISCRIEGLAAYLAAKHLDVEAEEILEEEEELGTSY